MTTLLEAPPYSTPEWVLWRRGGLGASELAAVMGMDPYQTERETWLVKTGQVAGFAGNPKSRWGRRLERVGIEVWNEAHPDGDAIANDRPFTDERWPHIWGTPDAVAGTIGIEVKVTDAWVTPPERVRVQALAQAGICGFERVDVVRLNFDDDPAIFRIERDEAAIEAILDSGEAWYRLHVIEGVEPPRRADETPADERQVALAADLREVRKAIEQLERRERAIRDDLIASVAGKGLITGPGFRIEVRAAHETTRTGWKELASGLLKDMDEAEREALIGLHQTTSRTGAAVYAKWDEED
jgi:hypothetical protein